TASDHQVRSVRRAAPTRVGAVFLLVRPRPIDLPRAGAPSACTTPVTFPRDEAFQPHVQRIVMDIAILGSGVVGQTLGGHLARNGHRVLLGTRSPDRLDEKRGLGQTSLAEWLQGAGGNGTVTTFEDAAARGEVVVNAT